MYSERNADPYYAAEKANGPYGEPDAGYQTHILGGHGEDAFGVDVRLGFIRKVYLILSAQLTLTTIMAGIFMGSTSVRNWVQDRDNQWLFWVSLVGSFVMLFLCFWKRKEHPLNLYLLAGWTVMEGYTLGLICTFYNSDTVLQAFIITMTITLALTAYVFYSNRDFTFLGPGLFAALMGLIMFGFLRLIWPLSETANQVYAMFGAIIFSLYIVYDTYLLKEKYDPDEYIAASISLYLDIVNLFIFLLQLLDNR